MELISMLVAVSSGILSIVKTFYDTHKERHADRDAALSEYFTQIADTLDRTVAEFRAGRIPHGACAEMAQYAQAMPTVLSSLDAPEAINYYAEMLYRAHHVERMQIAHTTAQLNLQELETIAGTFRAAATLSRLT